MKENKTTLYAGFFIALLLVGALLQGSAQRPGTVVGNNYNASYMLTASHDTFEEPEKNDKMNAKLDKFMRKHPGGQVTMSTSRYNTVVQYSYNK